MTRWSGWTYIFILSLISVSLASADPIPSKMEADYAKAVLAYHEKKFSECVQEIDKVLRNATSSYEFFELKALCLKSLKQDPDALKIYLSLIDVKERMRAPPIEQAPYYFEAGTIYLKKGDHKLASFFLKYAYRANYNRPICALYLGTIAIRKEEFNLALAYLQEAEMSGIDDVRPSAQYYLGTAYLGLQNSSHALAYLWEASQAPGEGGKSIHTNAVQALQAFDQSRYFANVSTGIALDTNVLFLPTTSAFTVSSQASSAKWLLNGIIGHSASPMKSFQFVPVYRVAYNYNFNSATKDGEFISNSMSLLGTFSPYEKTSYGVKLDGNYTFQNQTSPTGSRIYSGLLWTGAGGPFGRWILNDGYSFNAELLGGYQNYYLDATTDASNARSGTTVTARAQWSQDKGDPNWNPAYGLQALSYMTTGTEFWSYGGGIFLGNAFIHQENLRSFGRISVDYMSFPQRTSGARSDITLGAGWGTTLRISPKVSWINDFSYVQNISSVATSFSFQRVLVSSLISVAL